MKKTIVYIVTLLFFIQSAWMQENSLKLNQLIDHALENNYLLQANEKQIAISQAEVDIIRTYYLPRISLNASTSYWKFLLPNKQRLLGNTLSDVYTDITVYQTIYSWGEQDLRKDMIADEILLNEEVQRQIRLAIIWGVTDAYFETIKARAEIEVHQNALEQLHAHLQYAENLYNIGRVSNIDLLRINVQVSLEEKAMEKAINAHKAAYINLKRLCYFDEDFELIVFDDSDSFFESTKNAAFISSEYYEKASAFHPALKTIDTETGLEAKQKDLYRLENRPELYSYGIASWNDGYFPFGSNFNYNFGVGLRYTIPYWGGSAYKIKMLQSELRIDKMGDEKNQAFLEIKKEIDLALNEIADRKSEITNNEKIIVLAEETITNALIKYQSGQGNIIDVLDAQTILTESTISQRKSVIAYLQAMAKLHYLTGNDDNPF